MQLGVEALSSKATSGVTLLSSSVSPVSLEYFSVAWSAPFSVLQSETWGFSYLSSVRLRTLACDQSTGGETEKSNWGFLCLDQSFRRLQAPGATAY